MKACSTCREERPTLQFGKNKRCKDGLHYSCRSCVKVAQAATFQRHKAKRVAASVEWERQNPKARRAIVRRWRSDPKVMEREAARMRARRELHPELVEKQRNYRKLWCELNPDRAAFQKIKTLIAHQSNLRYRDVPDELAEAKAAHIAVVRVIRKAS